MQENPILNLEPDPPEIKINWIQDYISKNCPTVGKMKTQLSFLHAEQLSKNYKKETILEVLDAMENWGKILTKTSVYLTANNWCQKNNKSNSGGHEYKGPKDFKKQPANEK